MTRKSIVFTKPGVAELIEEELKEIKAGEVLVKLEVSTISSGTERANLTGDINISAYENLTVAVFPRRSGYSTSGVVEKVGEGVVSLKVGDRVAISWSTHSEYVIASEKNVYKIDDDISFNEAALLHISTFPMAAVRKCRLEIGESAVVMGLGVLGMIAVRLLCAAGAAPVIAVDPVAEKRKEAISYGADYALDPFEEGFAAKVKAITGSGVNVAIEVTGNGKALDQVLDCMADFGRVALLGCTRNSNFSIDYYHKVHAKGVALIGAHTLARPKTESSAGMWTTRDDVYAVQRLIKYKKINISSLIGEIHSPSEAPEIYTRLANEKSFPLIQFDWNKIK